MPTKTIYRTWCTTCNDWTWHQKPFSNIGEKEEDKKDWLCDECGTEISNITLGEIPKEKILEQRARYKEHKSWEFKKTMSAFMSIANGGTPGYSYEDIIIENDAGQKRIDEEEKHLRDEAYKKKKEEERQYNEKFKGISRNELCRCGSGKKFKKCCIK